VEAEVRRRRRLLGPSDRVGSFRWGSGALRWFPWAWEAGGATELGRTVSDGRGETETEGTCLTVVVGLRCGCLCELDSLRRGVRGRPATAGLSSCRICSYIFFTIFQ
jgi:hypothetical protein